MSDTKIDVAQALTLAFALKDEIEQKTAEYQLVLGQLHAQGSRGPWITSRGELVLHKRSGGKPRKGQTEPPKAIYVLAPHAVDATRVDV